MTKPSMLLSFETLNAEDICACVVGTNGQTVFASRSLCKLLGYRPEAIRSLPLERVAILHNEKSDKNASTEQCVTLIRRDGSTLTAHALPGLPVALASGGSGTLHCFADISRHQAMMQDQQAIINNLSLGVIFTRSGIVQRANRHAEDMLGYAADGLIGKSISELIAGTEDYQALSLNIAPTIARGSAFEGEVELRRADGSAFPCRFRGQAILPNDPTQGAVWICEDRSLINATEAALRMTREELEAVVDNAMIGMIMVEDRRIVWCNSKFEAMLGYEKNETVGKDTQMFYESRRDWKAFGDNINQLDDGTVRTWEQILRRKDGSIFWCYMSGRALFSNGELNKRTLWLLEDVTWRKEAEQTLIDAKTLAEEATRTKSIFLANMSHGIRTPMNAVICLSDILLRTDLVAEQREYAEKINEAGTALLGVIDDILDFSKIEAGKIELRQTRFSLDAVLDHIATLLGRKAHDKGIDLAFDTSAFLPRALIGDPQRLGQILTNLIGNAIKFTERGQVVVRARLIELSDAQASVHFEVRDTGIGIHLKRLSYLFEPFTEHDAGNDSQSGGTGLGLSICKHLVEIMGGSIKVSSKLGRGSTFSFDLRFGREASAEDAGQNLPGYLQGMRVLVVDPNPVSRDIRIRSLSTLGFRVDAADSGAEALGAMTRCEATDPCRIAFIDQKLPDIDGIEACRQLKNAVGTSAVPDVVLFISAGNANLKARAKEAGVDALLVKPISHSALEDTLSRLFNAKQRPPRRPATGIANGI